MASGHLADAIRDPSQVITDLYNGGRNTEIDFPARVTSHFASILYTRDSIQQVPPLSPNYPPIDHPNRSLVRFHAMIQDVSSPEMYLLRLPDGKCGGWNLSQDLADPDSLNINFRNLRECSIFWAITVPGESQWSAGRVEGALFSKVSKASPRAPYLASNRHKLPNPQSADFGVMLKVYDEGLTKGLKPMVTATFVGILALESTEMGSGGVASPVLHVTYVRVAALETPFRPLGSTVAAVYEDLIDWVSQEALAGDRDAAELIILCSVARVQSRNPPILPLSLQLTSFPRSENGSPTPVICSVLSRLLPLFSVLNLSLEVLNNDRFVPESNGEDLSSGYLQIPAGSIMLLTEIGIKQGNILEKGVRSLRDIQDVMDNQSLRYAFPFSQHSFNTEIGFILLVEGRRSLFFTTNISLPFQPQTKDTTRLYKSESKIKMPDQQQLDAYRNLLFCARSKERLGVPKWVAELIEHDFVEERRRDKLVTQDDLAVKITIARLLGLLVQADELSVELWERAKKLEARRKSRLRPEP